MARNDGIDRTSVRNLAVSDQAVGNTQQHNEREKDCYQNPDIIKVQREQERLDTLTAQADQKAQSLAKTSQTLSKKEKELAAVQKKATFTKEALIHARDLDYIGKRTFLGNYSLTEEEFSKLKKQADHGYMMDVENRRLKEELSTAKKEAAHWGQKYHELWYEVKPYLDALHRAPELVRGFLEKILAPKQERTMNVPQKNRKRGQDMEL